MDKLPEPTLNFRKDLSNSIDGGTGWISPEEFYFFGGATEEDDKHAAIINKRLAAQEIKWLEKLLSIPEFNKIEGDQ